MDKALALPLSNSEAKKIKTWHLFVVIAVLNLLTLFILNQFIFTKEVYYSLLSSRMEVSRIDDYFSLINKFRLWGYVLAPLVLWLKITIVALLIQLPLMIKFIEVPFKQIFRTVAWANVSMIFLAAVQIIYFLNIPSSQFTQSTMSFIPLSLIDLFKNLHLTAAARGVIKSINLFELMWIIIVYKGLSDTKKLEKIDAAIIAFSVWIGIVIFQFGLLTYLNKMGV